MSLRSSWKKIMLLLAATMALAVGVAACGSDDSSDSGDTGDTAAAQTTDATLVLDFIPGAVHSGIYEAVQKG